MIRRLVLAAVVLALAGCGGGGGKPAPTTGKAIQKKKLAAIARTKHAVTKTKNVPGKDSGCQNGSAPAFSPDGGQIAFGGSGTICIADRDGSRIHALPQVSVDSVFELAWASSTELLVDDDYAIARVPLKGGRPVYYGRAVSAPSFSIAANGQRFATGTTSDCPNCVGQAHVWTIAGKRVGAIGDAKDYYDAPSLSPDGKRVVYAQDHGVWIANADGSGARRLVSDGATPLWSPTGAEIAYANPSGLWVVSPNGGKPRLVARGMSDNGGWSPDGKFVASWQIGGVEIATVGNGKVRTLPLVGYPDYRASPWSPDSRDLLVTARLSRHCFALWREPVNGPKPVLLSSCF